MDIIPLGEECYASGSIDKKLSNNNFRKIGFPFDYVAGTNISNIYNNLYDLLINNEDVLQEKDFYTKLILNSAPEQKYYFVHKKYNFTYWHDIGSKDNNFSKQDVDEFINKYNRRYARLKTKIKGLQPITFLSVNHFQSIFNKEYKKDEILKLYNFLYEINNNIKFIAINFHGSNEKYNNLNFVNLNVNREIPIEQSKIEFTNNLNMFVSNYFT